MISIQQWTVLGVVFTAIGALATVVALFSNQADGVVPKGESYRARETFTAIATDCATKYDVDLSRSEREGIDRVSGNVSLDLVEFLLIFPEKERSKVALVWFECLAPRFEKSSDDGNIYLRAVTH